MHSDESIEADDPEDYVPVARITPGAMAMHRHVDPENPEMLPQELLGLPPPTVYDISSDEEEEDHTGKWRDGDLAALILGINHYRERLKGKFIGCTGGRERRDRAWDKVAGEKNYIYLF